MKFKILSLMLLTSLAAFLFDVEEAVGNPVDVTDVIQLQGGDLLGAELDNLACVEEDLYTFGFVKLSDSYVGTSIKSTSSSSSSGYSESDYSGSGNASSGAEKADKSKIGKLLGEFYITNYCSCAKCCGQYAYGRPKDKNGNDIVKGASGRRLIPNYSIAVDTSVIPMGTKVVIAGHVYRADDVGGGVKGKHIDRYYSSHQQALNNCFSGKVKVYLYNE